MYTGTYIVLFVLFVNVKEQLRNCETCDVKDVRESQNKMITREKLLNDIIFKTLEWKHKFQEKLNRIESKICTIQYNLMANIENEKILRKEPIYLRKEELENSYFNRVMIYNILCFIGKYYHTINTVLIIIFL